MNLTNYHAHSYYCDGKESLESYVTEAVAQGFISYGFSSHSPAPFECVWFMKKEKIAQYLTEIADLKIKYQQKIQLYASLEIDFVPNQISPQDDFIKSLNLDYTIGSIHFVDAFADGKYWEIDSTQAVFMHGLQEIFNGQIAQAGKRYFELTRQMLAEAPPTIVGHLDKFKMHNTNLALFSEQETWYKKEVLQTLEMIADLGVIVEVNTRGIYKKATFEPYPSFWILEQMQKMNIPITVNSDAHHPREISMGFEETFKNLQKIGFKKTKILMDSVWIDQKIENL